MISSEYLEKARAKRAGQASAGNESGELSIQKFNNGAIPSYAILSHTWGADNDEVTFADFTEGIGKDKPGYEKIRFCGAQAQCDGLQYFWIDTCCIDTTDKDEHSWAIRSMFRWYRSAAKCYVYLADVSMVAEPNWEPAFRSSRWFKRGWTLQELVAPTVVEFFSQEQTKLGDKKSLKSLINKITSIPHQVLNGASLSQYDINDRLRWKGERETKLREDLAYSLSGICEVDIAPVYGEGEEEAFRRLHHEIQKQKDCLRDLRLGNPRDDKKRIEETKGGLIADAYCWVLQNATFRQWRDGADSHVLWVTGDPGKGKTMLLCGIINEFENAAGGTASISYFFCQATDTRINSATAVLRGLLYMLIRQQPSLVSHVRKKHDYAGKSLFEDANAWFALTEIFVDVLQDPTFSTTYLIIDALDECVTDLPKLLNFVVRTAASSARLKWLLSSRNEAHIKQELRSINAEARLSMELKQNAEQVSCAVEAFIDCKLSVLSSLSDRNLRNQVRDILREKADNTFLWVALVIQELEKPESWNPLEVVDEAPVGLHELYDLMMSQVQKLKKSNSEICRLLLSATSIAYRPLCLLEIGSMCGLSGQISVVERNAQTLVTMCGSFLTIRNNQVFLVHQSAKDYLINKMQDTTLLSQTEAHGHMYAKSLKIMSNGLRRDMYVPVSDLLAPMRYSCVYWVDHLCESNSVVSAVDTNCFQGESTVHDFLKEKYLYWLEALSLCGGMPKGVRSIARLQSLFQGKEYSNPVRALVDDAYRFIMFHRAVIESYPLQTYISALLFSPRDSCIRQQFQHEEPKDITISTSMSNGWSECLQTLEGHSRPVNSVAFSHDSTRLASASNDNTIWDASSGTCLQTLKGHQAGLADLVSILAQQRSDRTTTKSHQPVCHRIAINSEGIWITDHAENMLWLPTDYRPLSSAVSGRCVGLGTMSGKVWICHFL
ncbi:HET-domain-containing protein [Setomelanomma holmii]|uniref:HET-domain-containing protein n=1 Tax=Setomelanomma holmii TaxID=210430 RepID=A0A9P4LES0_9PLEO|nr:HET-domain-containing protein [Setomelanomma holmii]